MSVKEAYWRYDDGLMVERGWKRGAMYHLNAASDQAPPALFVAGWDAAMALMRRHRAPSQPATSEEARSE